MCGCHCNQPSSPPQGGVLLCGNAPASKPGLLNGPPTRSAFLVGRPNHGSFPRPHRPLSMTACAQGIRVSLRDISPTNEPPREITLKRADPIPSNVFRSRLPDNLGLGTFPTVAEPSRNIHNCVDRSACSGDCVSSWRIHPGTSRFSSIRTDGSTSMLVSRTPGDHLGNRKLIIDDRPEGNPTQGGFSVSSARSSVYFRPVAHFAGSWTRRAATGDHT